MTRKVQTLVLKFEAVECPNSGFAMTYAWAYENGLRFSMGQLAVRNDVESIDTAKDLLRATLEHTVAINKSILLDLTNW